VQVAGQGTLFNQGDVAAAAFAGGGATVRCIREGGWGCKALCRRGPIGVGATLASVRRSLGGSGTLALVAMLPEWDQH